METPCHAGPTDDADGASSDSRHRSRTHDTEGPIAGIPENESGNDLDRVCSLIEDRLIRSEWLEPLPPLLVRFATLPSEPLSCKEAGPLTDTKI